MNMQLLHMGINAVTHGFPAPSDVEYLVVAGGGGGGGREYHGAV